MSTPFPATSLDTTTTLPTESANTPLSTNHVIAHTNLADAVIALETKVGIDSSAVATSLDYLVKNASSSNPGHKHTLANGATDVTATAAEVNKLAGTPAGLTSTEIGYLDGVTSAIQTQIDTKAADSAVVKLTGDQTVAGIKTFSSDPLIPDEAYGSGWNGVLEPPTKNAVYDKIETLANFNKIPNTDETSVSYRTYEVKILVSGPDSVGGGYSIVGWQKSNISPVSGMIDTAGGIWSFPCSADSYIFTILAPISKSQNNFRFNDLSASEVRIKMDLVPSTVSSGEIYGWGITVDTNLIHATRTNTAGSTARFVLEENGGVDKLWAVNSNGSNYNATDITGSYTLTQELIFELVITSTSIKYYVDGTLAATHTTYIPTGTNAVYLDYGFEYNGTGGARNIYPAIVSLPLG